MSEYTLDWRVRSENRMVTISLFRLPRRLEVKEDTAGPLSVESTILCAICLRCSVILALSTQMYVCAKLRDLQYYFLSFILVSILCPSLFSSYLNPLKFFPMFIFSFNFLVHLLLQSHS